MCGHEFCIGCDRCAVGRRRLLWWLLDGHSALSLRPKLARHVGMSSLRIDDVVDVRSWLWI
jgi:hypothetical protein